MYKAMVIFIMFSVGLCHGLSSYGDSGDFCMDTVDPLVEILSPAGGEQWFAGTVQNVQWLAQDHNFQESPISLYYSVDNGASYELILQNVPNNGILEWQLPELQTDTARLRIYAEDSFGNARETSSPQAFGISYLPPAAPENLQIDSSNGLNAILTWDPVTSTIPPYNLPFTPDGYIVLYNESPFEDEHYFYFLGRSYTNTYTHMDVVEFRDQMFYMVKAYKNYNQREADALESMVRAGTIQRMLWRDAERLLKQGDGK